MPSREFIDQLKASRDRARDAAEHVLLNARDQGRETLDENEERSYRESYETLTALNARIAEETSELQRAQLPAKYRHLGQTNSRRPTVSTSTHVLHEPERIYPRGGKHSFAMDLVKASVGGMDIGGEARRRLQEHTGDMAERAQFGGLEYRDLTRVDGSGGYAVPPAWLVDMYVELARPGRAFANLCQRLPLPGGTDSINIPKVLTGTTVAIQTGDNVAVSDTDITDTFINAPVRTIAGQQGVAIQILDQSPIQFDQVIFSDLIRAHAGLLDHQVIYGAGSNGEVLGVTNTPNIQTVAVSALTIQGLYSAIANAVQLINTTRYLPPEVICMHPRRWSMLLALLDNQQRPIFLPDANNPFNAAGILENVDSQQVVGRTHGIPIVTDPNITTTAGAGSNEDQIFVMRSSDLLLWEGGIRSRVLPETKAANLTVLLQVFSYLAFSGARYPQSVVQLTGLTPPSF